MSLSFTLLTIAEFACGLFLIWGFWHEEKIVEFEDKIFAKMGITRHKNHTAEITPFPTGEKTCRGKNCI